MATNIKITTPSDPTLVPFGRLVDILQAAFADQDDTVDPPSSAKLVDVVELKWRFSRDQLFLAQDAAARVVGQIWVEDVGKDAYLYKLAVDPALKGGGLASCSSKQPAIMPKRQVRITCAFMCGLSWSVMLPFSNRAGLKLQVIVSGSMK